MVGPKFRICINVIIYDSLLSLLSYADPDLVQKHLQKTKFGELEVRGWFVGVGGKARVM